MKTKYLLLGINEAHVLTDAYLTAKGVATERETIALPIFIGAFETANEAHAEAAKELDYFEFIEIKTVYTK